MSESSRVSVALFGAGRMGSVHLRHLVTSAGGALVWLVEEDRGRAQQLLDCYQLSGLVKIGGIDDTDKALNDPRVEAVLICTPAFTHEAIIKKAIKSGKPVFCEKPLAPTAQAVQACCRLARVNQVPLICGFNRRFDPQIREMQKKIASGSIGQLRSLRLLSRDPPATSSPEYMRAAGGIFIDSAIHDIDMACWLIGGSPETVYALGHATNSLYAECGDVDTCVIVMTYAGGIIATIEMSREARYGYDQRIEVFGNRGMLQSDNKRPQSVSEWSMDGKLDWPIYIDNIARYEDSYREELKHFLDVLQGKAEPSVSSSSTIVASQVATICKETLNSGKVVNFREWVESQEK